MQRRYAIINSIKDYITYHAPGGVFRILVKLYIFYKKARMPEQSKSFGELNPDKTFYVIRIYPPGTGFGAMYIYVLGYIKYAREHGWIPVVDMENYETLYSDSQGYHGKKNVWEYYFCQPFDNKTGKRYSLDEVYQSKNVILSCGTMDELYCGDGNKETISWQNEISKLVPFNQEMKRHFNIEYEKLLADKKKVLGVAMREGGRAKKKPYGHQIAPERKEMLQLVEEKLNQWKMDYIFVTSNEESCINDFSSKFANVLYYKRRRMTPKETESDRTLEGANLPCISKADHIRDYLTELYLLSRCNGLLGIKVNGLLLAQIWNGGTYDKYEYVSTKLYKIN